ncbi:uncharacterized protein V6R79_004693 [Siganus canaliculatus]
MAALLQLLHMHLFSSRSVLALHDFHMQPVLSGPPKATNWFSTSEERLGSLTFAEKMFVCLWRIFIPGRVCSDGLLGCHGNEPGHTPALKGNFIKEKLVYRPREPLRRRNTCLCSELVTH